MLTEEQKNKLRVAGFSESKINAFDLKRSLVGPTTQPQPSKPGFLSRVGSTIKGNIQQASESLTASGDTLNPLAAGANIAKNVSGAIVSPMTEALRPVFEKTIKPISEAVVATEPIQRLIDKLSGNPELAGAIADTLETGLNVAAFEGVRGQAKSGVNLAKDVVTKAQETVAKGVESIKTKPITPEQKITSTIEDATPSFNKKLIGERPIRVKNKDGTITETPRVSEGGVIKGRTVNPTQLEVKAGQALNKVPDYPLKGTSLQKFQAVQPEIIKLGEFLKTSLQKENILRPIREVSNVVKKAINKVSEESLLLQKTDPVIKNYLRVVERILKENDGTLAGELAVRKALDAAYNNARGKSAFGSDKISALDEIHSATRNALNKDIISHARNTDVKLSLQEQWDLREHLMYYELKEKQKLEV